VAGKTFSRFDMFFQQKNCHRISLEVFSLNSNATGIFSQIKIEFTKKKFINFKISLKYFNL